MDDPLYVIGGIAVILSAPLAQAHEVVTEATRKGSDHRATPDGAFEIVFGVDRAATVMLAEAADGTLVHILDFREQLGQVLFAPFWDTLRARIGKAAAAAGVTTHAGPQLTFARTPVPGDGTNGTWALVR